VIWFAFVLLAAFVVLALAWPLLRRGGTAAPRNALAVYRDQLDELERDRARGMIDETATAAARREIERRILAEDNSAAPLASAGGRRAGWAVALGVVVILGAVVIYGDLGSPELPARPLAARDDLQAPAMAAEEQAQVEAMVARLEARLIADPSDVEGWLLLANSRAFLGRFGEAASAMGQALALQPEVAEWHAAHGEFIALGHQGTVTPAARRSFEQALALDPSEPIARYYLAVAGAQAGEVAEALQAWRALYADTPGDAPWRNALVARIGEAEQQLGLERSDLAGTEAPAGPTREQMDAAAQMPEDEQVAMIRGMVEGLAARMEDEPDNLEGWTRLAQSYTVLGDWTEARAAYEHALGLAPEDPALLDGYANAIAGSLSQSEPIPADAVAALDAVLERQPANDVALYLTGLAAAQAGDGVRAAERWGRLRDLLPEGGPERAQIEGLIEQVQ